MRTHSVGYETQARVNPFFILLLTMEFYRNDVNARVKQRLKTLH